VPFVLSIYYIYSNPLQFITGLTIDPGNCNVHVTVRVA
jgi:hypothetical protein